MSMLDLKGLLEGSTYSLKYTDGEGVANGFININLDANFDKLVTLE